MAKQGTIHHGYAGPCPDPGQNHTYEFALYAFDVETLPGVTVNSDLAALETAMKAHQLARVTTSATSLGVGPRPANPP